MSDDYRLTSWLVWEDWPLSVRGSAWNALSNAAQAGWDGVGMRASSEIKFKSFAVYVGACVRNALGNTTMDSFLVFMLLPAHFFSKSSVRSLDRIIF